MTARVNQFDGRQELKTTDFEVFHNINGTPIDVDYHSHDFCEILIFISGNVSYVVEGKTYHLHPGDIMLTNNKEIHKPIIEGGKTYERYVVWIHENFLKEISAIGQNTSDVSMCFESSAHNHYNLLRPHNELFQSILQIMKNLLNIQEDNSYGYEILRRCYVGELLVYLNRTYINTTTELGPDLVYNERISDIIYYINQNLCEELTLDSLANQFYVSKYHLTRQFREYTGLSLHQYIIKKRLITAKLLLQQGCSVKEAYGQSGFSDYSHFSRSFVAEWGVPPRVYLKNENNKKIRMVYNPMIKE